MTTATTSERIWFDVHQAADHVGYFWRTIADLCRSGEIHGHQRKRGGKWRIHVDCLNAWAMNKPCPHADELARAG